MDYLLLNTDVVSDSDSLLLTVGADSAEAVESVAESVEVVSQDVRETSVAVSAGETALYSAIGFLIVFAVLLVLMAFIGVMSKVVGTAKKKPKAVDSPAPVQVPEKAPAMDEAEVKAVSAAACDDGACSMKLRLNGKEHNVSVKEQIPQFTITLDGKSHSVDVQPVDEEVDA